MCNCVPKSFNKNKIYNALLYAQYYYTIFMQSNNITYSVNVLTIIVHLQLYMRNNLYTVFTIRKRFLTIIYIIYLFIHFCVKNCIIFEETNRNVFIFLLLSFQLKYLLKWFTLAALRHSFFFFFFVNIELNN